MLVKFKFRLVVLDPVKGPDAWTECLTEKFQRVKIAKCSYRLNGFLTKSKSILTENELNQQKIIKNFTNCGLQPQYYSDKHQTL